MVAAGSWLLLLTYGLSTMMMVTAGPHQANTTNASPSCTMNMLDRTELGQILSRIAGPFVQMRDKRNLQLDMYFNTAIETFEPLGDDITKVGQVLYQMDLGYPKYQEKVLNLFADLHLLRSEASNLKDLLDRCKKSGITVIPARPYQTLEDDEEDYDDYEGDTWNPARQPAPQAGNMDQQLGKRLTCDGECQAIATTAANMAKHVSIEDVTAAFSLVISQQMEVHRQRYLAFVELASKAARDVEFARSILSILLQHIQLFQRNTSSMVGAATQAVADYNTGMEKLRQQFARISC